MRGREVRVEVQHEREQHADVDRELELRGERRDQRDGEHRGFRAARAHDVADRLEIDEAPRDQEEDARHRGNRQVARERRDDEQDHASRSERREDRGERRLRAGFVVQPAAVERAARRVGREEAADDVRQPLADEFLVAVDALLGAQRDRARDRHRFGEPEHRDRDRDRRGLAQRFERERRAPRTAAAPPAAPITVGICCVAEQPRHELEASAANRLPAIIAAIM